MEYRQISPGTVGISQKISSDYELGDAKNIEETSKLVFLTRNKVMPCGQNQY